jgi:hypothetical protein
VIRRRAVTPVPVVPSVIVEFHEFRGLWFLTDQWGSGRGAGVDRSSPPAKLGSAVLSRIEKARRAPRPLVIPFAEFGSARREEASQWERFCSDVAGVPVRDYRPEKRLVIMADERGLRCHYGSHSPPRWAPLAAGSPEGIGAALIAQLAAMAPRWPAVDTALVTRDGDAVLVCRRHGPMTAGPIVRLAGDASPASLGAEVLAALSESRPELALPLVKATRAFRMALRTAGWTMGAFDAAPHVHVTRTTVGELIVTKFAGSREIRIDGAEPRAVGDAVLTLLGPVDAIAANQPELRPMAFGPKTGWIAVSGASVEAVTAALGLRKARSMPWDEGVEAAYDEGVFVCPPISGWVLAAGADVLLREVDIAEISRQLGTRVQIFRTHRVPENHEWALADGGKVLRWLRHRGESGEHQQFGEPTEIERSLSVIGSDAVIGEGDVFAVAGAWSLDPTRLGEHGTEAAIGTWGRLR